MSETVDRQAPSPRREHLPDLLTRPPSGTREFAAAWEQYLVDAVAELEMLGGLLATGLISRAEFERYKRRVRGL
jgi:hypothetical protein